VDTRILEEQTVIIFKVGVLCPEVEALFSSGTLALTYQTLNCDGGLTWKTIFKIMNVFHYTL
jgi:hypothetical protein